MSNFFKYRVYVLAVLIAVIGIFSLGYYSGKSSQSEDDKIASILNKSTGVGDSIDFASFWKAWEVINQKYVPTNSTSTERVSDQARVYGAIEGMVKSLGDPYTIFFPPVESKSFADEISGNFEGVGMEVGMKDDVLTVIAPLKNTPAYRAGIKSGDKIVKIDDTVTNGLNTTEAIKIIKGPKGTKVKFTMVREGEKEPLIIEVIRDIIDIPTIDTETKNGVFIIHLYNFSAISSNSFRNALREFVESGNDKLILDLRGNPGGYLEAAVDMASWFLPAGKVIVKEDFKNEQDAQIFRSKGYNIFNENLKMVVLIDGGSASASEILAGALHEHGVATLIGTQSFGKGSVQELVPITTDTSLKVTIARWLTPNGNSISHGGLTPDTVVKFDEKEFLKGNDVQINAALEFLNTIVVR
ncbi:MAG: carboxyl-terminal processing protease [Patescibacteria group bacterium]|jgi:carboxyl-terminal processing protease|nr:carboxyl-terminal processing protease [Patescibacteria group bacterium]